jgi:hypothetical protein
MSYTEIDPNGYRCEGCGRVCRDPYADLAIIRAIGASSCCPERKMVKLSEVFAKVEALVEAAEKLRHAVCGETGFAECVRRESGKAYPWPALDEAEVAVDAALAAMKGGK